MWASQRLGGIKGTLPKILRVIRIKKFRKKISVDQVNMLLSLWELPRYHIIHLDTWDVGESHAGVV